MKWTELLERVADARDATSDPCCAVCDARGDASDPVQPTLLDAHTIMYAHAYCARMIAAM